MKLGMTPKWTHDCNVCNYLGSIHTHKGIVDWYKCTDSTVARFGSDGPDYWSMPTSMVTDDRYLTATRADDTHALGYNESVVLARFMLTQ